MNPNKVKNANWNVWHNRRDFFDNLGRKWNIYKLEDFYKINIQMIKTKGVEALMEYYYHMSLVEAMQDVFPFHKWISSKFSKRSNKLY